MHSCHRVLILFFHLHSSIATHGDVPLVFRRSTHADLVPVCARYRYSMEGLSLVTRANGRIVPSGRIREHRTLVSWQPGEAPQAPQGAAAAPSHAAPVPAALLSPALPASADVPFPAALPEPVASPNKRPRIVPTAGAAEEEEMHVGPAAEGPPSDPAPRQRRPRPDAPVMAIAAAPGAASRFS